MRAIDPPKTSALSSSWSFLKEIGAINEDDTITALGCAIVGGLPFLVSLNGLMSSKAALPVDVKLAKVGTVHT